MKGASEREVVTYVKIREGASNEIKINDGGLILSNKGPMIKTRGPHKKNYN